MSPRFERIACAQGCTLRDTESGQSMHSTIGPESEAELVFVGPSRLRERLAENRTDPLVLWDVGMGVAGNSATAWEIARTAGNRPLEIHSFERHPEALGLALDELDAFAFLRPSSNDLRALLSEGKVSSRNDRGIEHRWFLHSGDFDSRLDSAPSAELIYWDFYNPKVCPELWSLELFTRVRAAAPRSRLYTYSAATPVRVGLLLAGFLVGRPFREGRATPIKADSTMAVADLQEAGEIPELLGAAWLEKLSRSTQFRPYGRSRFAWGATDFTSCSYAEIAEAISRLPQFSRLR